MQVQAVNSGLDGIPSGQSVGEVDVPGQPEVRGVQDLVGRGVGQDGLGVDTGFVGESAETGDRVVERNVHADSLGHQVLQVSQLVQFVLGRYVVSVGCYHPGHQAAQRSDAVSLTNAQDRDVDQTSSSLQCGVCVGDGTARVIVEMALDVAVDHQLQCADQLIDASGVGTPNGVCYADSVDADLVDGSVDVQQVDQVGSEGVLGREADLDAFGLDKLNHLHRRASDVAHVLSVRVASQEARRADDDVHAVHAGLHGDPGVVHVASDVGQDFGFQAQFADGLAVFSAALGGHG